MFDICIERTKSSPQVSFESELSRLNIKGESYPENAFKFYEPLFGWMDEYFKAEGRRLQVDIGLVYLNTSSIKCIMDIIYRLEQESCKGHTIEVNWHYDKRNRNIKECGIELQEDLESEMAFNIIEVQAQE